MLEASRSAVGEQCTYGIEVHGTTGRARVGLPAHGRAAGVPRPGLPGRVLRDARTSPRATVSSRAFQPGAGIPMGFDDLKVIEARRLVQSIADGKPHGATIEDALIAARTVDAMVRRPTNESGSPCERSD